jgi:hypothetical protein
MSIYDDESKIWYSTFQKYDGESKFVSKIDIQSRIVTQQ